MSDPAGHEERSAFNNLFHASCEFLNATGGSFVIDDPEVARQTGIYDAIQTAVDYYGLDTEHAFALLGTALGVAAKKKEILVQAQTTAQGITPQDFHV